MGSAQGGGRSPPEPPAPPSQACAAAVRPVRRLRPWLPSPPHAPPYLRSCLPLLSPPRPRLPPQLRLGTCPSLECTLGTGPPSPRGLRPQPSLPPYLDTWAPGHLGIWPWDARASGRAEQAPGGRWVRALGRKAGGPAAPWGLCARSRAPGGSICWAGPGAEGGHGPEQEEPEEAAGVWRVSEHLQNLTCLVAKTGTARGRG